jgi:hypothetical protein
LLAAHGPVKVSHGVAPEVQRGGAAASCRCLQLMARRRLAVASLRRSSAGEQQLTVDACSSIMARRRLADCAVDACRSGDPAKGKQQLRLVFGEKNLTFAS